MTKDEIKLQYSMADILLMYGISVNRTGLIHCPFHKGDREPSMKIYKNDFHCFGCGANGDIFTFVQLMDNLSFKEAFERLGGTYEKDNQGHYKARLKAYRARKQRETECKQKEHVQCRIIQISDEIELYRLFLRALPPMSDLWCEIYNKLQILIYKYEMLREEVMA